MDGRAPPITLITAGVLQPCEASSTLIVPSSKFFGIFSSSRNSWSFGWTYCKIIPAAPNVFRSSLTVNIDIGDLLSIHTLVFRPWIVMGAPSDSLFILPSSYIPLPNYRNPMIGLVFHYHHSLIPPSFHVAVFRPPSLPIRIVPDSPVPEQFGPLNSPYYFIGPTGPFEMPIFPAEIAGHNFGRTLVHVLSCETGFVNLWYLRSPVLMPPGYGPLPCVWPRPLPRLLR